MSDESSESEAEQLEGGNIKGVDQVKPYNTDNSYFEFKPNCWNYVLSVFDSGNCTRNCFYTHTPTHFLNLYIVHSLKVYKHLAHFLSFKHISLQLYHLNIMKNIFFKNTKKFKIICRCHETGLMPVLFLI